MPELPEVQTTVNGINRYLKNLKIVDVWTNYNSDYHAGKDNIKNPKFFSLFKKAACGQQIKEARRRAKNILIELKNGSIILVHLKMTGHLLFGEYVKKKVFNNQAPNNKQYSKSKLSKEEWAPTKQTGPLADPFNRHIRLVFTLSNGKHLALSDMRRFAKITLIAKGGYEESDHLKDIGPEPLEKHFGVEDFKKRLLSRPNGKIKQVLLDPKIIAGIGNIYSDEILWRAGINPERKIKEVKLAEFKILFKAMQETLLRGIDFGGDSMSDYRNILGEKGKFQEKHEAYRRTGLPCKRKGCKGKIIRKKVGGRSAHFCSHCQK